MWTSNEMASSCQVHGTGRVSTQGRTEDSWGERALRCLRPELLPTQACSISTVKGTTDAGLSNTPIVVGAVGAAGP